MFIDAGYLFSGGSDLVFGEAQRRRDLRLLDPEGFIRSLTELAAGCCDEEPLRILRTYWYDGAVDGLPSPDQIAIGDLPRVKLRLGRVTVAARRASTG